jgi:hypothetical protein
LPEIVEIDPNACQLPAQGLIVGLSFFWSEESGVVLIAEGANHARGCAVDQIGVVDRVTLDIPIMREIPGFLKYLEFGRIQE